MTRTGDLFILVSEQRINYKSLEIALYTHNNGCGGGDAGDGEFIIIIIIDSGSYNVFDFLYRRRRNSQNNIYIYIGHKENGPNF